MPLCRIFKGAYCVSEKRAREEAREQTCSSRPAYQSLLRPFISCAVTFFVISTAFRTHLISFAYILRTLPATYAYSWCTSVHFYASKATRL